MFCLFRVLGHDHTCLSPNVSILDFVGAEFVRLRTRERRILKLHALPPFRFARVLRPTVGGADATSRPKRHKVCGYVFVERLVVASTQMRVVGVLVGLNVDVFTQDKGCGGQVYRIPGCTSPVHRRAC